MKKLAATILLLHGIVLHAAPVELLVDASSYPGQQATLYRYMDLFTRRLEPIARGMTDAHGQVRLEAETTGTAKALLMIGNAGADLWLRPGTYQLEMPPLGPGKMQSLDGTARVDLLFKDLDPLDVNALESDLNTRLDAFVAEGLATDQEAGMTAVEMARSGEATITRDTIGTNRELYLSPTWRAGRVDTFATKLRKFYAEVPDPWFQQDVEYGIAGLQLGPRIKDRVLFERYLKDKPVLYDVPEYVHFLSSFFTDHLLRDPYRSHAEELPGYLKAGRTDSLKALLAANDFLKDDRLNELVLMINLYTNHASPLLDKAGVLAVLRDREERSAYPEHREIAGNMVWSLTAMTAGTPLPEVDLADAAGQVRSLPELLKGPVCLMIVKPDNTYNEVELLAMDQLAREYGDIVRFVFVLLDRSPEGLAQWLKANPQRSGTWTVALDQRRLLDQWRVRNAPLVFLLDGQFLTASPAMLPSQGLVADLHRIRVGADEEMRLNRDRARTPPKR